jgi:hypothetical protein
VLDLLSKTRPDDDGRRPVGSVRLAQRFAKRFGVSVRTIYRNTAIAKVADAMLALYPDLAPILCKKRAGIGNLLKLAGNPEATAIAATLLARGDVKTIREAVQSSLVFVHLIGDTCHLKGVQAEG